MVLLLEYCGSSSFCKLKIIILQDSLCRPNPQEMITSRSYIFTKTSRCNLFIFSVFDEKKSSTIKILKISSRFFFDIEYEGKNGFHFSSKTRSLLSRTLRFERAQSPISAESFPSTSMRCNTCERNESDSIKGTFRKATVYF